MSDPDFSHRPTDRETESSDGDYWPGRTNLRRVLSAGIPVGTLGGMGAFVYSRPELAPAGMAEVGLLLVLCGGAYGHLLSRTMRESIQVALVGFVNGVATTVASWVAPLWIVPIAPVAREVLLMGYLQQALATLAVVYVLGYLSGYFVAMALDGLSRW